MNTPHQELESAIRKAVAGNEHETFKVFIDPDKLPEIERFARERYYCDRTNNLPDGEELQLSDWGKNHMRLDLDRYKGKRFFKVDWKNPTKNALAKQQDYIKVKIGNNKHPQQYFSGFWKSTKSNVDRPEITLVDVLRAIGPKRLWADSLDRFIFERWDLSKTFSDQSDATKDFLYQIICK